MHNFLFNDIATNIAIGFFYSALIGIATLIFTEIINRNKELDDLSINLTKLLLSIAAVKQIIDNISNVEGEEYRKFFGDVLDHNTKNKTYNYDKIYKFIIYDYIPELADLSKYMIQKFNETTDQIVNNKDSDYQLNEILKKCDSDKCSFVEQSGVISIAYYFINSQILSLNNQLSYYRSLTLELISTDIKNCSIDVAENKIMVFKECTDKIICSAKQIKSGLEIFENSLINHRRTINDKINKNKEKKAIRYLMIPIVIITIYLFIA